MEYVFGTKGDFEILKTKGNIHSDLKGFHQLETAYPDQTITDHFRVVCKIESKEDAEENCYDWYQIEHHYRVVDKTDSLAAKEDRDITAVENALCEQDSADDERMSVIEGAICELDILINRKKEVYYE